MGGSTSKPPRWAASLAALSPADREAIEPVLDRLVAASGESASKHQRVSEVAFRANVAVAGVPLVMSTVWALACDAERTRVATSGAKREPDAAGTSSVAAADLLDAVVLVLTGLNPTSQARLSDALLALGGAESPLVAARALVTALVPELEPARVAAIVDLCGAPSGAAPGADGGAWSAARFFAASPVLSFVDAVTRAAFALPVGSMQSRAGSGPLPELVDLSGAASRSSLLDAASMWVLAGALAPSFRARWTRLFHSHEDGMSFVRLEERILSRGPTLILVRDGEGHAFGGFARAPWRKSPDFFGEAGGFVFTLSPVLRVYPACGRNTHFQYLNSATQTQINGLGFGGQLAFMGLFLPSSLDGGVSRGPCSTYASPCLASSDKFTLSLIEAWSVELPPEPDEDDPAAQKRSVLRDMGARAFLEVAGVAMHTQMPDESENVPLALALKDTDKPATAVDATPTGYTCGDR